MEAKKGDRPVFPQERGQFPPADREPEKVAAEKNGKNGAKKNGAWPHFLFNLRTSSHLQKSSLSPFFPVS